MSDSATPSPMPKPTPPPEPVGQEIRIYSHSSLFYWWPVWAFGFLFALVTTTDNDRLVIVGHTSKIVKDKESYTINVEGEEHTKKRLLADADESKDNPGQYAPKIRVSPRTWMGPVFLLILFLVIMITNVPMRGLWSVVAIMCIVVIALLLSLFEGWERLLKGAGDLHIFINMAGYLSISVALFGAWLFAFRVLDRRTYAIFTPGQLRVCEQIGSGEKVYDTMGLSLEKRRDDWFRHLILGIGTGDLTIKTSGAVLHEIVLPNVTRIGAKINAIELMLREKQMAK